MSPALIHDLDRCNRMSALWDQACEHLMRRDYAAFDATMHAFRDINRTTREAGCSNKAPASNSYGK